MKKPLPILGALVFTIFLAACGNGQQPAPEAAPPAESGAVVSEPTTVRIGITAADDRHWQHVRNTLAEENITLEIITFTDWVTPNTALAFGDIDLNAFQTHTFLANFNEENNENLVAIGETTIMPMGIYSVRHTSLDDIGEGFTISIADDPTNGARALLVLQSAGLIEVDPAAGYLAMISDITYNPLNLNFIALVAQQLPIALPDVDFAVINAVIALEANLHPHTDSIFLEPITDDGSPFNNLIAARAERANEPALQAVVRHFQTNEVADIIHDIFDNTQFPVW